MPYQSAAKPTHKGWWNDQINGRIVAVYNGTEIFDYDGNDVTVAQAITASAAVTASTTLTVTGNFTISSTLTAGADGVGADGEQLTSGGAAAECDWAAAGSLAMFKHVGEKIDVVAALNRLVEVPVHRFRYRRQEEGNGERMVTTGDYDTEYVGVLADDLPEVMHYRGRIFSPVSAFGLCVAAIQALKRENDELKASVAALEAA